ncbi:MAG: 23S rRNA pseudouridine(1911/1915/1917) synthase RluD [Gammaproteobacteria bacterium]|jgi:23S rRNA pseudouridine1911/1915/1917 synthase|nr:23S rRNA pseudouridine(1911/1915/1917) synthase RluD [Gammaproteobacteria bacterium]
MPTEKLSLTITEVLDNKRLDQALAVLCPQHSRSRLQNWIRSGYVTVDGLTLRQRDKVASGQSIQIEAEFEIEEEWEKEDIPLNILYEDEALIVIDKPPGLVVHPGAGNPRHTLLNALLYYSPQLAQVPRAGIVQRLDKDTSGLMVIALTPSTHTYLVDQLQKRLVKREYQAIVHGVMTAGGTVDEPIGRHHIQRKRMAVTGSGKQARTHYRVLRKFKAHTHVQLQLESGRTHQIRVHMAHIHYPVVGDPLYGGRKRIPKNCSNALKEKIAEFPRQALHACQLGLKHPLSGAYQTFTSAIPDDIQTLLTALDQDSNEK